LDEKSFKQLLKDKNGPHKVEYLENGAMAEVHAVPTADGRTIIALILDLSAIEDLDCTLVHESVHLVYRIFEYIGEETPGEETRAYITEYVYKEVKEFLNGDSARKRRGKVLNDTSEKVLGVMLQMAEYDTGRSRPHSDTEPKDNVRRVKNVDGKTVSKTGGGV
jgi:hypothetical protein